MKAIIFDMDGVISDTQKFHAQVESQLLHEVGIAMTPDEITEKYAGVNDDVMFAELFKKNKINNISIENIKKRKWDLMTKIIKGNILPIPHATRLIQELSTSGFFLAIASSSPKLFIQKVLKELALEKYFPVVASSEEVEHGKPNPEIFLLASKRLHIDPKECVVIEDGKSGMVGAKKAGMKCIGLVSDVRETYPADILVTSLGEVTAQKIQNM